MNVEGLIFQWASHQIGSLQDFWLHGAQAFNANYLTGKLDFTWDATGYAVILFY